MKVLVLGGTAEARALAAKLENEAVLSLAGVTKRPFIAPHRSGGFGGVEGLVSYLSTNSITAVIDATHPFSVKMSKHAKSATAMASIPLLRLIRPAWEVESNWQEVPDLSRAAAAVLPAGARVFLSVGSQSLEPFLGRNDIWFLTRSIEPPEQAPQNGEVIIQHPPFSLLSELVLLNDHKITHLVSKNAGGNATRAKLEAASSLGIQVIMVKRPQLCSVLEVETVAQALNWLAQIKGKL